MMTRWIVLGLMAAAGAANAASFEADAAAALRTVRATQASARGATLSDKTTVVDVALSAESVKCSAQGYSQPFLKVLVPALADITLLNHRNEREGAPCIAAGLCRSFEEPQSLLSRGGDGVERVPVRVVLKREVALEGESCRVTLVETLNAVIRGVPFFHERRQEVASRAPADCR